jgi:tRNA nucleotidyltransferase (CCA-adding enzyme)
MNLPNGVALHPPRGVREIAERLEAAGFRAWCVGGAVRDALLGHPPLDWDLATTALPNDVQRVFRRTVPKGIEFGTIGVFDSDGVMHEVTTLRRDVRTDGRKAVVEFGASLEDDLARRDFTINAIAYAPADHALIDPFDGRGDLARGIVRAVGDADMRMREDRLRALRAIRFASRFEFALDPATWTAIVDSGPYLTRLSAERVREELDKTMEQVSRPSQALEQWRASGAFRALIPALADAPPIRFATVDCLPMQALATRPQRRTLRLAALWLDEQSSIAEAAMRELRHSNVQVRWTTELVARWALLGADIRAALIATERPSDASIRRWAAVAGRTRLAALLRLAAARFGAERLMGASDAPSAEAMRSLYRRAVRIAYRDAIDIADLAVDGADLVSAGIAPGPAIGRILALLLEAVVADPTLNVRDRLLALARRAADSTAT